MPAQEVHRGSRGLFERFRGSKSFLLDPHIDPSVPSYARIQKELRSAEKQISHLPRFFKYWSEDQIVGNNAISALVANVEGIYANMQEASAQPTAARWVAATVATVLARNDDVRGLRAEAMKQVLAAGLLLRDREQALKDDFVDPYNHLTEDQQESVKGLTKDLLLSRGKSLDDYITGNPPTSHSPSTPHTPKAA